MSNHSFTHVTGPAAPMLAANIDTDVIMPKQFLKGIDRNGLEQGLFHDVRFLPSGQPDPAFVLNMPPWQSACFLVVGPNFGCGSSREHAVWGLKQRGMRALIGSSFAGIFYDNCQRNGVLLISLEAATVQRIGDIVGQPQTAEISIDLNEQTIVLHGGEVVPFQIDTLRKTALLLGLDAIGSTLQRSDEIREFERDHLAANPWLS
ncbi:3-isopropylmalate dehydratase small subunit [Pseudomonas sp. MUP55]|uniref:3-isopropylmalate dehydratase small subunit n=1 Tax=Pseudomonas sp. MUP55 TaxID=3087234 RepID=UPI002A59FD11|nr:MULTISPECIES: 3-isopropylmalate dehydratase small subunit [unclassified Pseudomonas]WPN92773.1 3-isopropylmalate dehydratase small subunit [Pseudomonas sp. MUP56]WPN98299.1 3-isopropylmalate dehydratase small subunit [Pseudomonas sp. MUP55]